jgi:CheY-like chemotaxis protein
VCNLLNNAAKYTEPNGKIALTVRKCDGQAEIQVTDNGIGIPLEAQKGIFDLFVQLEDGQSRAQGGLGIGLTLAKRLVELHGGTIEVASEGRGRGSRFTVHLPLLASLPEPVGSPQDSEGDDLANLRVLIADDNVDAAASLRMLLELLGASVTVVNGGFAALTALEGERVDAAIVDIGMPDLDGLEVARRIRADSNLAEMALIALTGWGQSNDIEASRKAGFDRHLVKPVDVASLLSCLQQVQRRQCA